MSARPFSIIALSLLAVSVHAEVIQGAVTGVFEGDMLQVTSGDGVEHTVRLADIDSPDLRQPFAAEAQQALCDLALGKQVRVVSLYVDTHRRHIGTVQMGDVSVGEQLIEQGFAWHYLKQSDSESLSRAQANAKKKGLNIWSQASPVSPWDYRQAKREQTVFSMTEYLERRDRLPDPYDMVGVDHDVGAVRAKDGSIAVPTGWLSRPPGGMNKSSGSTKTASKKTASKKKTAAKKKASTRTSSNGSSTRRAYPREGS
jgi:micrococcal nuclease